MINGRSVYEFKHTRGYPGQRRAAMRLIEIAGTCVYNDNSIIGGSITVADGVEMIEPHTLFYVDEDDGAVVVHALTTIDDKTYELTFKIYSNE